jgi:hypothetical protein
MCSGGASIALMLCLVDTDVYSKSRGQKTILFFAFESGLPTSNRAR